MNQDSLEEIKQLVKKLGIEALEEIIIALRPIIPFIISNQELIPIALAIAGTVVPLAIGTTVFAVDMLSKVSLFGINAGITTVKATYEVTKTTASVATNILIKQPLYLLSYPFRKNKANQQLTQLLQICRFQQTELEKYKKTFSSAQQPDKLFLIIRELKNEGLKKEKDLKILIGSLDKKDRVERLLPLIRRNGKDFQNQSIQFICNKSILRLDESLVSLPSNQFGAIEIYYVMMYTFG